MLIAISDVVKPEPALVTQIMWNVLPDEQRQCGGVQWGGVSPVGCCPLGWCQSTGFVVQCGGVQFYFSQLTNLLVIANSSLNVVVYVTFNTRFRQVRHLISPRRNF